MPTHLTTTAAANAVLTTWLNKKFVRDLEFVLQHQKFTEKAIVPEGAGNVGRFLTFAPPSQPSSYSGAGGASISEGSTSANEITAISQTSTNITISEFGEFTKVGTLYEYAAVAGTRQKLLKRLKDGAYYGLDTFVRTQAATSTSALYATTGQTGGSTTVPTTPNSTLGASTLMLARKILLSNQAMGFEGLEGHPDGHYAAVITPKQELDIITEYTTLRITWSQGVTNVPGADAQVKWVNGYIGSIYAVATYVTNNFTTASVSTVTNDLGFVYADGGVGAMAFQDMNPQIILNDVNSPYKNLNTFAWHAMFGAGLIDSNRVIKLYSAS